MFELHGWAVIRFTAENRDLEDEGTLQQAAVERVRRHVEQLDWDPTGNPVATFRVMNGQAQLWFTGFRNHGEIIRSQLRGLFQFIALAAPGSYGLLYVFDDEDPAHANEFRAFVLARGIVSERADPFLSPFVPVVEDPYADC